MINFKDRTWVEVNLDGIEHNYKVIRNIVPKQSKICCVVKADAYGHGAIHVAKHLEKLGADFFAVSNIDEALQLRYADVTSPILILGYTPPERAKTLAVQNISQCIYSYDYAVALAQQAKTANVKIPIHIKIDTGMGRLGFVFRHSREESLDLLLNVCSYDCFYPEGIFTHFPTADEGEKGRIATKDQFSHFCSVIDNLSAKGIRFKIKHCSNSAAILDYPEYSLDMVRLGISLYGALPSMEIKNIPDLQSTITLKTVVSNVKNVKKGDTIGYGGAYSAPRDMKIATIPMGYADGFHRINYKNGTQLLVNGKLCNIVGRICMDQLMLDIDGVPNVKIGDEVVVFGSEGAIDLYTFAQRNDTIPYEVLCTIGARVPRFYKINSDVLVK